MADPAPEPTMEDILASIRRIIADDEGDAGPAAPASVPEPPAGNAGDEGATGVASAHTIGGGTDGLPMPTARTMAALGIEAPAAGSRADEEDVLELTQPAPSAGGPAALSSLIVGNAAGPDNTLEGLVREMLRPMLKAWLDAHLPDVVERLVTAEIARITGKRLGRD